MRSSAVTRASAPAVAQDQTSPCSPSLPPSSSGREAMDDKLNAKTGPDTLSALSDADMVAAKDPWWYRYTGYSRLRRFTAVPTTRRSRTWRAVIYLVAACIVCVVLIVCLYRSNPLDDLVFTNEKVSVTLDQGVYIGGVQAQSASYPRAIKAFLGIPYAQSTAGDNRFRPPQNLTGSLDPTAVNPAIDYGDYCPQQSGGAEDCLNVNIFMPYYGDNKTAEDADMAKIGGNGTKLPVVIYVHGGGFNSGFGKERNMASFVSWAEEPVIGISFNYRVGALGFLPSNVTKQAGLLNLGLKDQQMLFSWVQKNVAAFEGDANNVTIMGLSAGSHSIGHQLISYSPANKLTSDPVPFQRAILESGAATARSVFVPTHPLHETQFQEFLAKCNMSETPENEIFTRLRELPLSTITAASNAIWNKYDASLRWAFQPSIDGPGGIIPDLPSQSWIKGNVLRIPILTGFDTNEGAVFVPHYASNSTAMRTLMGGLIPALNATSLATMEQLYPDPTSKAGEALYTNALPKGYGTQFWQLDDAYAHFAYICPVLWTAHYTSTSNSSDAPVHVYQYAAKDAKYGGTAHGDEAPMVVHDMSKIGKYPGLVAAADEMTRHWSRFVAFGDPNHVPPSSSSASSSNDTWTQFQSPFAPESPYTDINTTTTTTSSSQRGLLALFGQGNDEQMGKAGNMSKGVPMQMVDMTERLKTECRFWWLREVYSEGWGNGSLAIS